MSFFELLKYTAVLLTWAFGLSAFFRPRSVAKTLKVIPKGKVGLLEIRATYGGWILGLTSLAVIAPNLLLYQCIGFGWLGAGLARMTGAILAKINDRFVNQLIVLELFVAGVLLF